LVDGENSPLAIAVDENSVYWTASGLLKKVSIAGGSPVTLASNQPGAYGLAVDKAYVYWANYAGASGAIMKVGINGGNPTMLAPRNVQPAIAIDDTAVYYALLSPDAIMRVATAGGTPTTLVSGYAFIYGVTADPSRVYWTNYANPGSIDSIAKIGGAVKRIADGGPALGVVAVDSKSAYWVTGISVLTAPIDGGAAQTLASGDFVTIALALDGNSVYWATFTASNNCSVMKLAK